MTITRVQRASMSSMSCVVRMTVTPRSRLNRLMESRNASFETASRPIVGSSRNRIEGRCSSAAARSHRIRWPRLSCRTGTSISGPRSMICTNSSSVVA